MGFDPLCTKSAPAFIKKIDSHDVNLALRRRPPQHRASSPLLTAASCATRALQCRLSHMPAASRTNTIHHRSAARHQSSPSSPRPPTCTLRPSTCGQSLSVPTRVVVAGADVLKARETHLQNRGTRGGSRRREKPTAVCCSDRAVVARAQGKAAAAHAKGKAAR